jgi:hypothetical protein
MAPDAMFANYCCDLLPQEFLTSIAGLIVNPNKKSGAFFPTGKGSSSSEPFNTRCNTNTSQLGYGYEISFDPAMPSKINCALPSVDTGTYYLYVLNFGTTNVTLADLSWTVQPLTTEDSDNCAAQYAPPVSSGARRVGALVSVAALFAAVWL